MADARLTGPSLAVRYRLTPWWVKVLVVFVVSRVVTTAMILAFAAMQETNPWTGAHPGYLDFAKIWDGRWYEIVAEAGYPRDLPIGDNGQVAENAWAFMPGYPMLVRLLMTLSGLDFKTVAVIVSVLFALGTALLLYRLVQRVLPGETALFTVVLYCFSPLSPILQVAYAESMFLFFVTLCLFLLQRRSYVLLLPAIFVMAFTRPGGLAFALAIGIHIVHRFVMRRSDPFPMRDRVGAVGAAAFSALAGVAWILIAWAVTGVPGAYTDTELAWRAPYIGYQALVPFTPWLFGANWWIPIPFGAILLVLVVIAFGLALFTPAARRLGVDLRAWIASYALYVLAVFFPQSSTFRILMPLFPALGILAQPRSVRYRVIVVLACLVLQVGWLNIAWWFDGYDWTPP